MKKSDSVTELAKALNKFQAECSGAKKGSNNTFLKSKYADLAEVINCAKEALANNGLSVSQFPVAEEGRAGVVTILMHESGEWIEQHLLLKVAKNDPQGMGSAITYARRYAYQAVLGIPSEDDDGNAATRPAPVRKMQKKAQQQKPPAPKAGTISAEQVAQIKASNKLSAPEARALMAEYGYKTSQDILIKDFAGILSRVSNA